MKHKKITTKVKKQKKDHFREWLNTSTKMLIELYGIGATTVVFHEKVKVGETMKDGVVFFRINYSNSYKTANIWYYPAAVEAFQRKDFGLLRQGLTHEIAHILTNKLSDLAGDRYVSKAEVDEAIESLTETIGQLCRKLMDAKKLKMV